MSASPTRLLVLGIDAASPELVERWAADGTLPNLAALMARGTSARLRGVEGFFVGSTWPSLYTGTTPARHGVHYLWQLVPGTYTMHACAEAAFVQREPFWRALSRAGRRVAVLDVPLSRLEPGLHGVQTVEWGGHDAVYGFHASPPELGAELLARHGAHPAGPSCDGVRRDAAEWRAFVEALELGVRRKAAWTAELLARGGWDLFMQVFTESHCVGHQAWHLHDPAHPAHDAAVAAAVDDPLRRVYRAIDDAVGALVRGAGEARVVVLSGHGMAHWHGAQFLLREILFRLGVSAPPAPAPRTARARAREVASMAWRALPAGVRSWLRPLRDLVQRDADAPPDVPSLGVDPVRSRCFVVGNGQAVGGIRLNLAGREPQGIVAPGAEERALGDRLAAELLAIVDERTGRPLVRRVRRTADLYQGELLDHLPDLLVEWSDDLPTGSTRLASGAGARVRARSPAIGVVEGANDYGRTGEHRPDGWIVAAGPGIGAGRLPQEPSLLDVAPTLTRMLGVTLDDCDGRAIPALAGGGASDTTPRA